MVRPCFTDYFMNIALSVRERANCRGRRVGAVLTLNDRIIATGYNGTPAGIKNCTEGGCYRCDNRDKTFKSGTAYDICICVHAEQNALLSAARFGIAVEGATLYTTHQPCFGCAKELLQAKVAKVYYIEDWDHPPEVHDQYLTLLASFKDRVHKMETVQLP
jgi:dCMP deaminase